LSSRPWIIFRFTHLFAGARGGGRIFAGCGLRRTLKSNLKIRKVRQKTFSAHPPLKKAQRIKNHGNLRKSEALSFFLCWLRWSFCGAYHHPNQALNPASWFCLCHQLDDWSTYLYLERV